MKKGILFIILTLAVATGFAFTKNNSKKEEIKSTIKIEHSLGAIDVPENPSRVVVFDYGILDTLRKMEVEPAGLPKASLPQYLSQYKDEKYANVGDLKDPNLEKIYELKPELIIISGRQEPFYAQLSKIAPTLYLTTNSDDYMVSFEKNMTILGDIFSKKDFMSQEVSKFKESINEIGKKVKAEGSTGAVVLSNNGRLSIYGEVSRFGIIHKHFGFKASDDIKADNHGNKITFEYLLEKNPDYIFVVDRSAVKGGEAPAAETFKNSIIESTKAYQKGNIVFLDSEVWYNSIGGLESTEKMIQEIEKTLK